MNVGSINIAFDIDSSLATVHACIVRSFAARSRRYAAHMQRCTRELDLAMLPISYRSCRLRKRARQSQQTRRQSRLPLRPPRTHSAPEDDAAPAQRSRGRKIVCAAPTPRRSENHCHRSNTAPLIHPAAIVGCAPRWRQPRQHWRHSREGEDDREDLAELGHHLRSALAGPWLRRHPTPGKWPARFFLLYFRCSTESYHTARWR